MSSIDDPALGLSEELVVQNLYPRNDSPRDLERRTERSWIAQMWWENPDEHEVPANLTAMALSGGGIRSATFSLGAIQSLAKSRRNALGRIDILSTVSGGGYVGCFLRSLFMPDIARGLNPAFTPVEWDEGVKEQYAFADALLSSGIRSRNIRWHWDGQEVVRRNPLWWLREHSRYLAPNGPTDYSYAAAYVARNWFTMLYIFIIGSLATLIGLVVVEAGYAFLFTAQENGGLRPLMDCVSSHACARLADGMRVIVSPSLFLAIPAFAFSLVTSTAYWMTQRMSPNEQRLPRQWKMLWLATLGAFGGAVAITLLTAWFRAPQTGPWPWRGPSQPLEWSSWSSWLESHGPGIPPPVVGAGPQEAWLSYASALIIITILMGIFLAFGMALFVDRTLEDDARVTLTIQLRTKLTRWLANSNLVLIWLIAIGLVDTAGAEIAKLLASGVHTERIKWTVFIPILAYLIKKLPDWLGRSKRIASSTALQRFLPGIAAFAGVALFGSVAVASATVVHLLVWEKLPWGPLAVPTFALTAALVLVLAVLAGTATGIINLSSLHSLYASRLTRAYLGATNNERLREAAEPGTIGNITETEPKDYIRPELYFGQSLPAPMHLMNITLNETIDPESELVSRDRKGQLFSLEPQGISVADRLIRWNALVQGGVAEQLSLGQWCAISGAALSSGMGRFTSFGYAMTLTFANVRLGYWWHAPRLFADAREIPSFPIRWFARWFGTFVYLGNEMTARYSRFYSRKYLTDGGHFENTAVYRLIARKVPLIIVCDNGADPDYRFEDLENLSRKARLDLGTEISLLRGSGLTRLFEDLGTKDNSIFVDPNGSIDWRDQLKAQDSDAFVVALAATHGEDLIRILWIKPRVLFGLPPDVLGYASANEPFPQQPTGDQFFNEAQWESYRALGEICMTRLLEHCPELLRG